MNASLLRSLDCMRPWPSVQRSMADTAIQCLAAHSSSHINVMDTGYLYIYIAGVGDNLFLWRWLLESHRASCFFVARSKWRSGLIHNTTHCSRTGETQLYFLAHQNVPLLHLPRTSACVFKHHRGTGRVLWSKCQSGCQSRQGGRGCSEDTQTGGSAGTAIPLYHALN